MQKSVFSLRVYSSIIMVLLFVLSVMLSRELFQALMLLISAVMLYEWHGMVKGKSWYLAAGLVIIPTPVIAILIVSSLDPNGHLLLTYFGITWVVDTFAMFGGRLIGGKKLTPKLSPNKTYSGLISGCLFASSVPFFLKISPLYNPIILNGFPVAATFLLAISIAFIAQCSDLFISYFKRKFNIKDTGSIIPGHGGMLDRFDSWVFSAPCLLVILLSFA